MKQGTNFVLPVLIEYDLSLVESIDFIFKQPIKAPTSFSPKKVLEGVQKTFTYPSDTATLSTTEENTVNLHWSAKDTYKFDPEEIIYLDTKLFVKGSEENPETEIIKIKMLPTLFRGSKV